MSDKLLGKVAFITGAGSGMGKAIALEFARQGARIVAVDIDKASVANTCFEIGAENAFAINGDISVADSVKRMCDEAIAHFGRVDILVNNAGILDNYLPVTQTDEALWDKVLNVNLKSMFLTTRMLIPQMVDLGGGVIINVASIAAFVAGGGGAAYTASKHGVVGLTRQIAFDYGPKGVRANAICPGAVETGMTKDIFASDDATVMASVRSVPAGRYGKPEEIAKLALYLASEDSSFVHGAAFVIDGGWTIK
jgi:3-oxoacyl-[acyl-carrier protein] reductase